MNVFGVFARHHIFSLNTQRRLQATDRASEIDYLLSDQQQVRSLLWGVFVLYAFRMPGARRMPGKSFTGIKPVVRCMMSYLDQYPNHHLKTNGKTMFNVDSCG